MILEDEEIQTKLDTEIESIDMESDIDDSEELEQKKYEVNGVYAEGNSIQNQINIGQGGPGGVTLNLFAHKMTPVKSDLPINKKYDLRKQESCVEFVEKFKGSEYFTTAMVLCAFEAIVLTDLPDLKSKILPYLPKEIAYDTEGKAIHTSKESPYISTNTVLAVIGGKKFTTEDGKQCITIGDNSIQALANILEQFPVLQDSVLQLIPLLMKDNRYCTKFYYDQIASLLADNRFYVIVELRKKIISDLCVNSEEVYLMGTFLYKLYKKNKEEAKSILLQWLCVDIIGLWKTVSFAYVLFRENNVLFPFEEKLRKTLLGKISCFRKSDYGFIADLLKHSKDFRTMVCSIFSEVYKNGRTSAKQRAIAKAYLYLVRCGYYKVGSNYVELPLVACDTKQQQDYLTDILHRVMAEYRLRKQIYAILKAYLKELSHYEPSEIVIKHIAAFCYNITSADEAYREDMRNVLLEYRCKVARQVVDLF